MENNVHHLGDWKGYYCDYLLTICPVADLDTLNGLFNTPFKVLVKGDDNRVGDIMRLREEYFGIANDRRPPSCLELIIVLTRLLVDWCGDPYDFAFSRIYNNMIGDRRIEHPIERVRRIIDREYGSDGRGGLFPLRKPLKNVDMSKTELYYQMTYWLEELEEIYELS